MCKVSDKSEIVSEIIGWFDMELPNYDNIRAGAKFDAGGGEETSHPLKENIGNSKHALIMCGETPLTQWVHY